MRRNGGGRGGVLDAERIVSGPFATFNAKCVCLSGSLIARDS